MQTRRSFLQAASGAALAAAVLPAPVLARAPVVGTQAPGYYRVRLGDYEITALSDGTVHLPLAGLYENIGEEEARAHLADYFQPDPTEVSVNAYLINTGERLVLVDAGTGALLGPTLGRLVGNIEASGYRADQIDDVILTHIHTDHSGGLSVAGRRVFENAVVRANWREAAFWLEADAATRAHATVGPMVAEAEESLRPYIEAGQFETFEDDASPVEGFASVLRAGHTPGHSAIVVESGGETLVFWGDIVHGDVLQFDRPDVAIEFDIDKERAVESRTAAFAEAADRKYLVAGAHHNFPGIGRVRRDETNYAWVPLPYTTVY